MCTSNVNTVVFKCMFCVTYFFYCFCCFSIYSSVMWSFQFWRDTMIVHDMLINDLATPGIVWRDKNVSLFFCLQMCNCSSSRPRERHKYLNILVPTNKKIPNGGANPTLQFIISRRGGREFWSQFTIQPYFLHWIMTVFTVLYSTLWKFFCTFLLTVPFEQWDPSDAVKAF